MDRDRTPDGSTPQPTQTTPKTPTNNRVKSSSVSRTSPYSVAPSPPASKQMQRSGSSNNNSNNTPALSAIKDEPDSTTPVYPESSILVNSSASNAKIQLSDMQPVNPDLLERIKNLEISLKQHRDSEDQLLKNIKSTKQEYNAAKEHHEQVMRSGRIRLEELKHKIDLLQAQSLRNTGILQELWDQVQTLNHSLEEKKIQVHEHKAAFLDLKNSREEILSERQETEEDQLRILQRKIDEQIAEYNEILELVADIHKVAKNLEKSFGQDVIKELKAKIQDKDERILQLQAAGAQFKSALVVEEKNADDLMDLFRTIYSRRMRTHEEELQGILLEAKHNESVRAMEAETAMEEYNTLIPLLKKMEDKAGHEEYELMIEQQELCELEKELESLKLELQVRSNGAVENGAVEA
ncbi:hypothetical protein BGX27_001350 [Mortierella sp. AM989]|nr:hypothetical protein BGX27_001350 [Mortierella sp. AM989]